MILIILICKLKNVNLVILIVKYVNQRINVWNVNKDIFNLDINVIVIKVIININLNVNNVLDIVIHV